MNGPGYAAAIALAVAAGAAGCHGRAAQPVAEAPPGEAWLTVEI